MEKRKKQHKSIIRKMHFSYITFVLLIIGIAIGILVTSQWRTVPSRSTDPVVSYSSLLQTKEKLIAENKDLKQMIEKINRETSDAQNTLKHYTDLKSKVEQVEKLEKQVGLTDVNGEGIIITLDDAQNPEVSSQSITHAADLRDIANLLWGNGASAIEINGERIIFNTSIDCIVNTILINSTKTTPPFTIKAIGDSENLYKSISDFSKLSDIKKRVVSEGLVFKYEKNNNIDIKPYNGSIELDNIDTNE